MKVATVTRDYDFVISGFLIKSFKKNTSVVLSDILARDIMTMAGPGLFVGMRDLDGTVYRKYEGEDLSGKSIAIWRTGGMGDLCFITPYLKKLKELYPTCRIIFGCGAQYSDVMSQHPCIDEFHSLPIEVEILSRCDFHLMFEGIIEGSQRATQVNAYDLFGEYFRIQLTDAEKYPNLPVDPENLKFFRDTEAKHVAVENPIRIGIHMKTSSKIRNVPVNLWRRLVYTLLDQHPRAVVYLIGSREDADVGNQIPITKEAMGRVLPFYQIVRGFRDSVAALSCMDVVIGGDSSGLHIAAAFEIPSVGLFGAFRSDLRLRYYTRSVGFDAQIRCSPCFQHGDNACDNSDDDGVSYCMMLFDPQKIAHEAMSLLVISHKVAANAISPAAASIGLSVYREHLAEKKRLAQIPEEKQNG